jgi:hypothetical protein
LPLDGGSRPLDSPSQTTSCKTSRHSAAAPKQYRSKNRRALLKGAWHFNWSRRPPLTRSKVKPQKNFSPAILLLCSLYLLIAAPPAPPFVFNRSFVSSPRRRDGAHSAAAAAAEKPYRHTMATLSRGGADFDLSYIKTGNSAAPPHNTRQPPQAADGL